MSGGVVDTAESTLQHINCEFLIYTVKKRRTNSILDNGSAEPNDIGVGKFHPRTTVPLLSRSECDGFQHRSTVYPLIILYPPPLFHRGHPPISGLSDCLADPFTARTKISVANFFTSSRQKGLATVVIAGCKKRSGIVLRQAGYVIVHRGIRPNDGKE